MGPGGKSAHFAQLAPVSGFQGTKTSGVIWRGAAFNLITAVSLVAEESLRPPGRTGGSPLPLIWPNHRTSKASQRGPRRRRSVSLAAVQKKKKNKKNPGWWKRWLRKEGRLLPHLQSRGTGPSGAACADSALTMHAWKRSFTASPCQHERRARDGKQGREGEEEEEEAAPL